MTVILLNTKQIEPPDQLYSGALDKSTNLWYNFISKPKGAFWPVASTDPAVATLVS